jgi:hypothetical protein
VGQVQHVFSNHALNACENGVSVIGCAAIKSISPNLENSHADSSRTSFCALRVGALNYRRRVIRFTTTESRNGFVHPGTTQSVPVSKRADGFRNGLTNRVGI